jgi:hypothetical protein
MRRRKLIVCLAVAFAAFLGFAWIEQTRAAGFWNMPGTHAQRAGHGYGGGYHAPLILGPVRCDGWHLGAPVRVPYAPSPYYGCGNCGDGGQMVEAPSSMESVVSTAAPTPMPAPADAVLQHKREPGTISAATSEIVVEPSETAPEPATEQVVEPVRPLFDPPVQQ